MRVLGVPLSTLIKVLAFALVSAMFTVLLAIRIGNLDLFSDTASYEAEFSDANGVFVGDAVKVAGVDVGRVTGTRIEDGKAVIAFDVGRDMEVTTTSTVSVRWRNIIGLRFLYVDPGVGGTPLPEGARIPDERTDEAGDLTAFLNRLGPILRAIDPEKANAFLDAMNTALAGNATVVRALLTSGAVLADELGDMDTEIQDLIESSDIVLDAYAGQHEAIGSIVEDLDAVGAELAGNTEEINSLVVNLAEVQRELERLLRENREDIDAGLGHATRVTEHLAENTMRLRRTLCTLPMGVAPYHDTTAWGEWFNVRIVEAIFKDGEGNLVAKAEEEEDVSRPPAVPATECPRGTPVRRLFEPGGSSPSPSPSGSSPASASPSSRTAPTDPPLPAAAPADTGLERWIDSLVGDP